MTFASAEDICIDFAVLMVPPSDLVTPWAVSSPSRVCGLIVALLERNNFCIVWYPGMVTVV